MTPLLMVVLLFRIHQAPRLSMLRPTVAPAQIGAPLLVRIALVELIMRTGNMRSTNNGMGLERAMLCARPTMAAVRVRLKRLVASPYRIRMVVWLNGTLRSVDAYGR